MTDLRALAGLQPKVTRRAEIDELIATGQCDWDSEIEVSLVLSVKCDVCGPITKPSRTTFKKKGTAPAPWADNGTMDTGTLYIPRDEGILLSGDAEDMLEAHWDRVHPGVPRTFITDGQHVRMAADKMAKQ